ncbi:MAG TPA: hypothetical protein ENH46_02440 [Candidatus Pacearchaeota archaeon]|nr:hypothetical protein [Candidatus Pacearchaeota archaeon]
MGFWLSKMLKGLKDKLVKKGGNIKEQINYDKEILEGDLDSSIIWFYLTSKKTRNTIRRHYRASKILANAHYNLHIGNSP